MTVKRSTPIYDTLTRADYYRWREGDMDKTAPTNKKKEKKERDV